MKTKTKTSVLRQSGAALVEYALVLSLVAVVCIPPLRMMGLGASDNLGEVSEKMTQSSAGGTPPPPAIAPGQRSKQPEMSDGGGEDFVW